MARQMVPAHRTYCEPCFLEGEVLFSKRPSAMEIINDRDGSVIEFYLTVRTRWEELSFLMDNTLYADEIEALAERICRGDKHTTAIYRTWALWMHYNSRTRGRDVWLKKTEAWLESFRMEGWTDSLAARIAGRISGVRILNRPPEEVMTSVDAEDTLFYIHPTNRRDFMAIAKVLPDIKGKYILYYNRRKPVEDLARELCLVKETDADGNTVYMNFRRHKLLFDGMELQTENK